MPPREAPQLTSLTRGPQGAPLARCECRELQAAAATSACPEHVASSCTPWPWLCAVFHHHPAVGMLPSSLDSLWVRRGPRQPLTYFCEPGFAQPCIAVLANVLFTWGGDGRAGLKPPAFFLAEAAQQSRPGTCPHITDFTERCPNWAFESCPPTPHHKSLLTAEQPPCTPASSVASLSIQMGRTCTCFELAQDGFVVDLRGIGQKDWGTKIAQTLSLRKEN